MSDMPVNQPRCTGCQYGTVIAFLSIGPLVRCGLYGVINDNDQAAQCPDYQRIVSFLDRDWGEGI